VLIAKGLTWYDKHGQPPRAKDWTNVRGTPWPSYQTCVREFGSWDAFISACGWTPRGRGQPLEQKRPAE
jgi:hypothetical protein